jgi:hypothetical protein
MKRALPGDDRMTSENSPQAPKHPGAATGIYLTV